MKTVSKSFSILLLLLFSTFICSPIYAGGNDNDGYTAESGENIELNGNNVTTDGHALWAKPGGMITIHNGRLEATSPHNSAVYGTGGNIILKNVDIFSPTQSNSYGIEAKSESIVDMTGGSITTGQYYTHGIIASGKSKITLTYVDIATYGWFSWGIMAAGGSEITMTGGSIKTHDQNNSGVTTPYDSYGVYSSGNNSLITLNDVQIATYGSTGNGAWGLAADAGGKIVMNGGSVYTEGAYSHGLAILVGEISANGTGIQTKADNTHGAYAYAPQSCIDLTDTDIVTSGKGSYGLLAWDGSLITMEGGAIATSGEGAFGVRSINAGSLITLEDVSVETSAASAHALKADGGGTIRAASLKINADDSLGAYAILAGGTSAAISKVYGEESFFQITGAIVANDYSSIDMALANGSYLKGWTSVTTEQSTLDMAIDGPASIWEVTKNSTLTNLTLNASAIDYGNAALETTITVKDLNAAADEAGGSLFMKTDIANELADLLIVTGTTAGSHFITVSNDGSADTNSREVTLLVKTADRNGSFALSRYVDVGGWRYTLEQNIVDYDDGAGWELRYIGPSPGGDGGVNTFYASYLLSYAETETLIKRLGDLRQTPDDKGLWFRVHGGRFESNSRSYTKPFDMKYYGVHAGFDRKIEIDWDGDAYAGIMFGYSKGDLDYLYGGRGSVDSKMIGAYATWTHPNGFFADVVLKYQWMDNDFDVLDSDEEYVTGGGVSTGGFGASLELGQRIHFAKDRDTGWYIEPQVQMSYMRQDGGYFHASNGLRVGINAYTSLLGRLGALVGYENEAKTQNIYAKISKVKEFEGDITIGLNGQNTSSRFGSSWWVYGIGYTSRINDRNSVYLDLERTSGGCFTQEWAVKAGWRATF